MYEAKVMHGAIEVSDAPRNSVIVGGPGEYKNCLAHGLAARNAVTPAKRPSSKGRALNHGVYKTVNSYRILLPSLQW